MRPKGGAALAARVTRRLGRPASAVLTIAGATVLGQLVALAATPLLSRLFPPGVYGLFAVVNSIALSLAVVACLRYDQAVPLPEDDAEASALAGAALALGAVVTAVATVAAVVAGPALVAAVGADPALAPVVPWGPVVAGLMGAYLVLSQLALRHRLYASIARRNLVQAVATAAFQVGAGALDLGAQGLAGGLAAGQLVGVVAIVADLRHRGATPRTGGWRALLGRYRRFPLLLAPSGLVNALGLQVPVLVAAALVDARAAGLLGMTQRIMLVPMALLGVAIAQVFLGEFSAARRAGRADLEGPFLRASRRLAPVGLAVGVLTAVLAPTAFTVVLGTSWSEAGEYARLLSLAMVFQFVASPLSQALIVLERLGQQVAWDVGRLLTTAGAMVAVHAATGSVRQAVLALGVAGAVCYLVQWWLSWRAVRAVSRA